MQIGCATLNLHEICCEQGCGSETGSYQKNKDFVKSRFTILDI